MTRVLGGFLEFRDVLDYRDENRRVLPQGVSLLFQCVRVLFLSGFNLPDSGRSLLRTAESITTPCSVKAYGR